MFKKKTKRGGRGRGGRGRRWRGTKYKKLVEHRNIVCIFLIGPSSSGKTHGFNNVFLPTIQQSIKGNIYKIDGGIMRDESCTIQQALRDKNVSLDGDDPDTSISNIPNGKQWSQMYQTKIDKREKIYKNIFSKTKKKMTTRILPKIQLKESLTINTDCKDKKFVCSEKKTTKTNVNNDKLMKSRMEIEEKNRDYLNKIICKSTIPCNPGDEDSDKGIVFVETYASIFASINPNALQNHINKISKQLKNKKKIFCWNNAPKLYCEISGYSRGIIDGKKYDDGQLFGDLNTYNLVLNKTATFLINQIAKKHKIYVHYNTWGKNKIINYEFLNDLFLSDKNNQVCTLYNKIDNTIKDLENIILYPLIDPLIPRLPKLINEIDVINNIKQRIKVINNNIVTYLEYISKNKDIKYSKLIELIRTNKLLRDIYDLSKKGGEFTNFKSEFHKWIIEQEKKVKGWTNIITKPYEYIYSISDISININVLDLGWEKNENGWKNILKNMYINDNGSVDISLFLNISNQTTSSSISNSAAIYLRDLLKKHVN